MKRVVSRYKFTIRHKLEVYDIANLLNKLLSSTGFISCLLSEADEFKRIKDGEHQNGYE